MALLCQNIKLTEGHPELFAMHRSLLRKHMASSSAMNEMLSFLFDQRLVSADFSDISAQSNWVLKFAMCIIEYYLGAVPAVQQFMTSKLQLVRHKEAFTIHSPHLEFPSLFILSHCLRFHFAFTANIMRNWNVSKTTHRC